MLKIHRRIQLLEKERSSELLRPTRFVIQLFAGNGKYAGSILYSAEAQERIFETDVADLPDRNGATLARFDPIEADNDKDTESLEDDDHTFGDALPEWTD